MLTQLLGLGIPVQAVVGGVTVLTGLNPWIVGIHFMISSAMIAMAAAMRLQAGVQSATTAYAFDVKPRWPLDQVADAVV